MSHHHKKIAYFCEASRKQTGGSRDKKDKRIFNKKTGNKKKNGNEVCKTQ